MIGRILLSAAMILTLGAVVLATPEPAYAAPKVGACKNYGYQAAARWANRTPRVPCRDPHTSRIIKVGRMVSGTTWKTRRRPANVRHIRRACVRAERKILGANHRKRDRSAYSTVWFGPTKAQWDRGRRWFRCDLVLHGKNRDGSGRLMKLPTNRAPFLEGRRLTTLTRACVSPDLDHKHSCRSGHTFLAKRAFWKYQRNYPTREQFINTAKRRCPSLIGTRRWAVTWPLRVEWATGDHVMVCYRRHVRRTETSGRTADGEPSATSRQTWSNAY